MTETFKVFRAWEQFLIGKRELLSKYDQAKTHSKQLPVATHHGVVAEGAVREWLSTFLPKRFAVTPGYIRNQDVHSSRQSSHFDVIIYDYLNSPVLWVDNDGDKSDRGRARMIPAEHVRAVLEVKSAFSYSTVQQAKEKLTALEFLMAGTDAAGSAYPRYLSPSAVLGMVFFELRGQDRGHLQALDVLRDLDLGRFFYGAVILRGEGRDPDDSALIHQYRSDSVHGSSFYDAGLLHQFASTASVARSNEYRSATMMWSEMAFTSFAFDLLAILQGTYRPGYISSNHGVVLQDVVVPVSHLPSTEAHEVAAPARRGPGRPRKAAGARPVASGPKAKPSKRGRRSAADVEQVAGQVLAYVQGHPGQRLEEIGRGLGVDTAGLKRPVQHLIATGRLRTEGQKRGKKYLPGSGKAALAKAKATRSRVGKRKAAKRGRKAAGRAKKK